MDPLTNRQTEKQTNKQTNKQTTVKTIKQGKCRSKIDSRICRTASSKNKKQTSLFNLRIGGYIQSKQSNIRTRVFVQSIMFGIYHYNEAAK